MKNLSLILIFTFIILFSALSQSKKEKTLYKLDFSEENKKKFIVSKYNEDFIFRTYNKKKKEVETCKWEVKINYTKTLKLITEIEQILSDPDYTSDNYLFNIKQNKKYIKLMFKNSSCISEHKLYYFQKDCDRSFIIKMKKEEFEQMLHNLKIKKED